MLANGIDKYLSDVKERALMQMKSYCSVGGDITHIKDLCTSILMLNDRKIQTKKLSKPTLKINHLYEETLVLIYK